MDLHDIQIQALREEIAELRKRISWLELWRVDHVEGLLLKALMKIAFPESVEPFSRSADRSSHGSLHCSMPSLTLPSLVATGPGRVFQRDESFTGEPHERAAFSG